MTNVRKLLNLLSVFGFALPASAADPTLSATPPMTWNSWNHFACKVTAADARSAADAIAGNGMKDAGYVYVNIDDCSEGTRAEAGRIEPKREAGT